MGKAQATKGAAPERGESKQSKDISKAAPAEASRGAKGQPSTSGKPQAAAQPKGQSSKPEKDKAGKAAADGAQQKGQKGKGSEIDDIFNFGKKVAKGDEAAAVADVPDELKEIAEKIKRVRDEKKQQAVAAAAAAGDVPAAKKSKAVAGGVDDLFGEAAAGGKRKRTEEGYPIYSEEELGMGRRAGGDTPLCPFDCDCCF